ncbi:MAG TPA: replication-associated recombination protein A [Chlamydiales bacterium]|nr:replication-associated recombination protein A [Chlamydiales bacterium]
MNSIYKPLAEQQRPIHLDDVVGQTHLIGYLRRIIQGGKPLSLLFCGPPGCGKTTLARIYAQSFNATFIPFSAVHQGIADLKKIIAENDALPLFNKPLILFVDEIHRFNKGQQDAFLPLVESGKITLVGATTENPSFSLNNALLSRLRTLILNPLSEDHLLFLINRYKPLPLTEESKKTLAAWSSGDARHLFNMLESLSLAPATPLLNPDQLTEWVQQRGPLYDKKDEGHYNLISALHKSVRGSDPNASLYWLCRMLNGGEDRQFLARRMIRIACEDIGLADPNALQIALHAWQAYEHLGDSEGDLALAEAIIYLALAPKSNAIYTAFNEAIEHAKSTGHLSPPKIILNAPTRFMKEQGRGKGYIYDHDTPNAFSGQNYFPDGMERREYYTPPDRGFERELNKRIEYFNKLREM